ncbi:AzlD domain-containing protein [Saccharothrix syringae]|uniref:AzlD domain-containing protein n=1 Tax=Saccharothrix syringae TaxID=103733 RepID=A0A5Q0H6L2_SACSY|nr:AzlD domain-containing protein [Saccharothrix syringae]QFZ21888.1 AzlD domain-containing protein [Saccharothrix syringae]
MTLTAVLLLAAGTFALRLAGPLLRDRVTLSERVRELMSTAATVMLFALVAVSAFTEGRGFAGPALPVGVLVGAVAAWRRAPFAVVVVLAAGATALLRLAGVD